MNVWRRSILLLGFLVFTAASCASSPSEEAVIIDQEPARLRFIPDISNELAGKEGESPGYSVTFTAQDQQVHGVPAAVPFPDVEAGSVILDIRLETHVHTNENPVIEKPCFGPIGIRNDETGETEEEITGFCFPDSQVQTVLLANPFNNSGPFSWEAR